MIVSFWGGELDWSRFNLIKRPKKLCFEKNPLKDSSEVSPYRIYDDTTKTTAGKNWCISVSFPSALNKQGSWQVRRLKRGVRGSLYLFWFKWNSLELRSLKRKVFDTEAFARRCSAKKGVLRNFAKFIGKHLCQSLFFYKVAGLRPGVTSYSVFWRSKDQKYYKNWKY